MITEFWQGLFQAFKEPEFLSAALTVVGASLSSEAIPWLIEETRDFVWKRQHHERRRLFDWFTAHIMLFAAALISLHHFAIEPNIQASKTDLLLAGAPIAIACLLLFILVLVPPSEEKEPQQLAVLVFKTFVTGAAIFVALVILRLVLDNHDV